MAGVSAMAYHPNANQQLLLSGSADATLRLWDLRAKDCILQHKGHNALVTTARFSPDGRWAATGGADGVLNVWEVSKPQEIFTFRIDHAAAGSTAGAATTAATTAFGGVKPIPAITTLAFHPTLPRLATATTDKAVRLWDLESFELAATSPAAHPAEALPVRAMAFDAAGATLHTATDRHWRAMQGATLAVEAEAKPGAAWHRPAAVALVEEGDGEGGGGELLTASFNGHIVSLFATDVTGRGRRWCQAAAVEATAAAAARAPAPAVVMKRPAVAAAPTLVPPPTPEAAPKQPAAAAVVQEEEEEAKTPAAGSTTIASTEPEASTVAAVAQERPVAPPHAAAPPAAAVAIAASVSAPAPSQPHTCKGVVDGDKENRQEQPPAQLQPPARPSSAPATAKPAAAATVAAAAAAAKAAAPAVVDIASLAPEERLERAEKELVAAARLHRGTLTAALTARLELLQALREQWAKGDVARASKVAARIHAGAAADQGRLTALADFFRVVDLGAAADAGLTLELAAPLVPVAASLAGLAFENHVAVGLRMLEALLGLYGEYVQEVLATPAGGRVDLSREERVAQCRAFYDAVAAARARLEALPAVFGPALGVHAAAGRVKGQVGAFLG